MTTGPVTLSKLPGSDETGSRRFSFGLRWLHCVPTAAERLLASWSLSQRHLRLTTSALTPDMHRVHHSPERRETDSNFGLNLPWWDRLFGTYRAQPEAGHESMRLSLSAFRDRGDLRLDRMLLQPFRRADGRDGAPTQKSR